MHIHDIYIYIYIYNLVPTLYDILMDIICHIYIPRSTHCLLPISDNRDRARANANRSSSPANMDEDWSAFISTPRSSMSVRTSSGILAASPSSFVGFAFAFSSSLAGRKMFFNGTSLVRTNFAYNRRNRSC